jgi:ribose transport system permease protein
MYLLVALGGTSLAGGYGAIWRTAVGLAIIATISNGFNLLDINPFRQNIVKGHGHHLGGRVRGVGASLR